MKKIICSILIAFLFVNSAFAYGSANIDDFSASRSKIRILYGLILVVGGGFLAYDGFRDIKVDISNPEVKIVTQGKWSEGLISGDRKLESKGTIENTGNVNLKQVAFEVRYRSTGYLSGFYYPKPGYDGTPAGQAVTFNNTSTILYTSKPGQTDSWGHSFSWNVIEAGVNDPLGLEGKWYPEEPPYHELVEVINVRYSYEKKYKTEMNNVYEGIAGVVIAGAGLYILIDYVVGLKKFDYYLKKNDMQFYVTNNHEEFRLNLAKRI